MYPGLPASALGPYLVSNSPLQPEEEVFSISIEREKRAPMVCWQLDSLEEKIKEDSTVFVFPNSPPPEPVDSSIVEQPATPPPIVRIYFCPNLFNLFFPFKVQSLHNPATPRRVGKGSRGQHVHNYRCEDVMEYAVDVFAWKKSLEAHYLPGDWTRWFPFLHLAPVTLFLQGSDRYHCQHARSPTSMACWHF